MAGTLDGKVALVTGAASGLGRAFTDMLTQEKCTVVCADCNGDRLDGLAAEMPGVVPVGLDVSDASSIGAAWRRLDDMGGVDILINNAGVDHTLPIPELTVDQIDHVLDVNLRGPFLMSREALTRWSADRTRQGDSSDGSTSGDGPSGQIINICSTASKRAWPNASAYHASKWGLLGLSHAMHIEARDLGVRVTAVVVGGMQTPFILERFPDTPLENLQDPANVAEAVRGVLKLPLETVVPELMVVPMRETSWP